MTSAQDDDLRQIEALVGAHFDALRWKPGTRPDWDRFSADFHPEASLFAAARPVRRQTLEAFIQRMNGVAEKLHSFEERTTGMQVLHFGNVAVALAASEMLENESEVNRDVSAYLLLKDGGAWRIAAHAWDKATAERPVPKALRGS